MATTGPASEGGYPGAQVEMLDRLGVGVMVGGASGEQGGVYRVSMDGDPVGGSPKTPYGFRYVYW